MEGQSLFPVVLLAPGSARLAGSQRDTDEELLGEPKRHHLSQPHITLPPCKPLSALPGPESLAVLAPLRVMSL